MLAVIWILDSMPAMAIYLSMVLSMALFQLKLHATLGSQNSAIVLYHLTLSHLKLNPPNVLQNPDLKIGGHSVPKVPMKVGGPVQETARVDVRSWIVSAGFALGPCPLR